MDKFSRKKKRLRLKSQWIRKVHPSEVDNSDENKENVNMALFQEDGEEAGMLLEYSAKRRRRNSRVVQDDDEEVVQGTEIIEIQNNVVENSEVPVNNRVEDETKDDTDEQHQIDAGEKVQSVVAFEQGSQSAPSQNIGDEVTAGDLALARDSCEGKGEGLALNVDKIPLGEHEEDVRTEALLSDYTIGGANVMVSPFVSMEKREIVCCLYVPQPKMRNVKKLKRCREGKSIISATPTGFLDFSRGAKLDDTEGLDEHFPTRDNSMKMIEKAIEELNEEDGSSEEAISDYILANYEGLPWAHKRFLSYYLDKLCKNNEVVYTSNNRYSIPRLMDKFIRKKKRLRLKSQRIRKVHPSEVDNSDGNKENVNMALFQEDAEEAGVLLECSAKRRRRNSRVVEDDEEELVEGTEIVEIHNNVVENSKEVNNRVEDETNDDTNEGHQITVGDKVQSVVAFEQGSQSAPSQNIGDEVTAGDLALARDPCEGEGEGLVSNVDKIPLGEHEEDLRTEALLSDYTIGGANVMVVPFVSMGKREIVCCLYVPQPKMRNVKKLKQCREKKSTISATPTAFLDFSKGAKLVDTKGLHEQFPTRANLIKLDPKLLESSMLESPRQSQQGHKSSAFESNLMICDVEGFIEHEHGKQKLHSDSCPSSLQSELMPMEDKDLNIPLKQVVKMHGKQRKSSTTHRKRKIQMLQYDGQHRELGENEQIKEGHGLSHDVGQYDIIPLLDSPSVKPSSPSRRYLEGELVKQDESDVKIQGLLPDLDACIRSLESSAEEVAASKSLNDWRKRLSESGVHRKSDGITIGERDDATNDAVFLNLHDQWKEGPLEPATCKAKMKDGRGRPRKIKEKTIEDVPPPLDLFTMRQKELAQAVICESENKDEGENSSRQTEPVVTGQSTHDQSHERPSEQANEGSPVQATHQIKKQWESEAEVYEAPFESEQATDISDDVTLVVDQHCKQEEQRRNPIEKQGWQSRSRMKVEQNLNNHVPPSLPTRRSSRINRKYQIGILTCMP